MKDDIAVSGIFCAFGSTPQKTHRPTNRKSRLSVNTRNTITPWVMIFLVKLGYMARWSSTLPYPPSSQADGSDYRAFFTSLWPNSSVVLHAV